MIIPQKCFLYNNVAFLLKDFPEDVSPQSGDKCLFIRDKNLCVPVFNETPKIKMPTDGLVFYASMTEDSSTAETGQSVSKNGSIAFEEVSGIPCAHFDGSSYFTFVPSGTEFEFLTQTNWTLTFNAYFERGHEASEDLEGLFCSEEPNKRGALFSYRYVRGLYTGKQDTLGIGVNGYNEFTTEEHVLEALSWYFIAIERNGSALRLRVNNTWYEGGTRSNLKDALKLYMPGGSPKLKGAIAGVRIYNRVLTEDEYSLLKNEFV